MPDSILFYDNDQQPARQPPPGPVRVTDYRVMPWPDGTRVTVEMGLTPFKEFPAMDVSILSIDGQVLRTTSMMGALERRPAPTMHLPNLERGTKLAVLIELLEDKQVIQQIIVPFEVGGPIIKQTVTDAPREGLK
jgi:hypothetical protein